MNLKNKKMVLLSMTVVLVSTLTLNFTGGFSAIFSPASIRTYTDPITIDFITIQSLIKAVSKTDIPVKTFVEAIDSLNRLINIRRIQSPFVKRSKRISKNVPLPGQRKTRLNPNSRVVKKRPKITVNGIVWDETNPYAILNGEIYRVGDEIKGFTIQAIMDTMVVLSNPVDEFFVKYNRE